MRPLDQLDPAFSQVLTDPQRTADIIVRWNSRRAQIVNAVPEREWEGWVSPDYLRHAATACRLVLTTRPHPGPVQDGRCTMDGKLAGSVLTIDRASRNVTQFAGWSGITPASSDFKIRRARQVWTPRYRRPRR